jgi:hypothetical protein
MPLDTFARQPKCAPAPTIPGPPPGNSPINMPFVPFIQNMIKSNINKYKNRTSVHENQLIKDHFTQTLEEGRLKRIWPEDLLDEV